jgi:hypothetical protein
MAETHHAIRTFQNTNSQRNAMNRLYRTRGSKVTNGGGGFRNYYTKPTFNYYVVWMLPVFVLPDKLSFTVRIRHFTCRSACVSERTLNVLAPNWYWSELKMFLTTETQSAFFKKSYRLQDD